MASANGSVGRSAAAGEGGEGCPALYLGSEYHTPWGCVHHPVSLSRHLRTPCARNTSNSPLAGVRDRATWTEATVSILEEEDGGRVRPAWKETEGAGRHHDTTTLARGGLAAQRNQ